MRDIEQIMIDYVLGHATAEDSEWLQSQLDKDATLHQRLKELQDLVVHISPTVSAAPPSLRDRVLQSVSVETRFFGFAERLAELFDLSVERMRTILQDASSFPEAPWETSLVPGMHALHFDGGEALSQSECGIVHMEPGTQFPSHAHHGDEATLVLQGEFTDDDGSVYLPGDVFYKSSKDVHSYRATGTVPLMFVVFHNGIDIK